MVNIEYGYIRKCRFCGDYIDVLVVVRNHIILENCDKCNKKFIDLYRCFSDFEIKKSFNSYTGDAMSNEKCWGTTTEIYSGDNTSVNILNLKKGKRCSWHRHKNKFNLFRLISGSVNIKTLHKLILLYPGESNFVTPGTWHEFQVLEDSVMVEIMYTTDGVYDPNDIERANVGGDLPKEKHAKGCRFPSTPVSWFDCDTMDKEFNLSQFIPIPVSKPKTYAYQEIYPPVKVFRKKDDGEVRIPGLGHWGLILENSSNIFVSAIFNDGTMKDYGNFDGTTGRFTFSKEYCCLVRLPYNRSEAKESQEKAQENKAVDKLREAETRYIKAHGAFFNTANTSKDELDEFYAAEEEYKKIKAKKELSPYEKGYASYPNSYNPFESGSCNAGIWAEGYFDAKEGLKPRY